MGPNPPYVSFLEEEKRHVDTQGKCHVTGEAEIGVMQLTASQGIPGVANRLQKLEEAREDSSQGLRGKMALRTPRFWTSNLLNCERTHFCRFKPPSLWLLCYSSPRKLR